MLAYDRGDIKTAGAIGTYNQLKKEIVGFNKATSADLQAYVLKDYKNFKKSCVVNGEISNPVYYELENFVYNTFARIKRGCNGHERIILKKFNNRWAVVYVDNKMISCEMVNAFSIPQPISYNCENKGVVFINPNP
jgi:hypothetical protein